MSTRQQSERGIALVVVMLLTVAVTALVAGAIYLTSTAKTIAGGQEREEEMRNAADAGIELGRSALNGGSVTLPDSNYVALFTNQSVQDANGVVIPNVTRSVYYGPTGSSTGQYGIFASIVSVINDASGAVVVRRGELAQESFAKFAYYSDSEGSGICFGGNDQIFGPLHSNDDVCIYSSGARFHDTFDVSGVISPGKAYGTFDLGYTENGSIIPLPTITALSKLAGYATTGGMNFTAPTGGNRGEPRLRIEFLAIDLDGDGRVSGPDEGFYRIYSNSAATMNTDYVGARRISSPDNSLNCGHYHNLTFFTAAQHKYTSGSMPNQTIWNAAWTATPNSRAHVGTGSPGTTAGNEALSLNTSGGSYRCWLGGDDHLFITTAAGGPTPRNTFSATDTYGGWVQYTATPDPAVIAGLKNAASLTVDTSLTSRTLEARYLWPLSRTYNPNNKGVIYVNGRVGISGVLNGRLTIASNADITILDDMRYAITPGSAPCLAANILGVIANDTVFMANNSLNAAWDYTQGASDGGSTYRTYDDSGDETLHGVVLTLKSFGAEDYSTGSSSAQPCNAAAWGRGCLYLTGGLIQGTRGAVGTGGGTGYTKAYSYDVCAFQTPPPYFPTTGRYIRNRYYEIDPVGFNVLNFYRSLAPTY